MYDTHAYVLMFTNNISKGILIQEHFQILIQI